MIGFGSFGGFSYPTRRAFGDPQSGQVQSDDEFGAAWKSKIDSVPKMISTGGGSFNLIQGADGFNEERASPILATMNDTMRNAWLDSQGPMHPIDRQLQGSTWDYANSMGISLVRNDDGTMSYQANAYTPGGGEYAAAQGASHMIMEPVQYSVNPEWQRINTDFQQSTKERGENQTRQQQAYDTVLGGDGYIGGVMNDRYTNPTAGQITGRTAGFGGMGGFGSTMPPDIKTMGSGQPGTMSAPQAQAGGVMGQGGSDLTGIVPDTMGLYSGGSGVYRPQDTGMTAIPRNDLGMGFGY